MIRALLTACALLLAVPAQAQHIGNIAFGSPSGIEMYEDFPGVYTGEAHTFRHALWEGNFYSTNASIHIIRTRTGTVFASAGIGSVAFNGQSSFGPVSTGGFNLDGSSGDNSGIEIWTNDMATSHLSPMVTGVDTAEFCLTLKINGHAGIDHFRMGWRRWDSGTGVPDDATADNYTDMVALGYEGADTAGAHDLKIFEIKDDAATVTTDTTDNVADDTSTKMCVQINADLSYAVSLNGAATTAVAASPISVVTGELMKPFVRFVKDAGHASLAQFLITEWEVRLK